MLARVHGQTVDGAVAGHHAAQLCLGDGGLEGLGVDLAQKPLADLRVRAVDAGRTPVKAGKMLGRGLGMAARRLGLLNAAGVGHTQGGGQSGVLAVGLGLAAHAGVPGDVQHRGQHLGKAEGRLLTGDDLADLALQFGIKARAAVHAGGEGGGILDKRAVEALHVENRRDMQTAVFHHQGLQLPLPGGRLLHALTHAEAQGADLADAVFEKGGHFVLISLEREHARQLGDFFVQRHFLEQQLRPLPGGQSGVHIAFHGRSSFDMQF